MLIRMNFKASAEIPSERDVQTGVSLAVSTHARDGAERAKQAVSELMADGALVDRVKVARAFFQELSDREVGILKPATQERLFALRAEYTAVNEDFLTDCALLIAAMLEDWRCGAGEEHAVA